MNFIERVVSEGEMKGKEGGEHGVEGWGGSNLFLVREGMGEGVGEGDTNLEIGVRGRRGELGCC